MTIKKLNTVMCNSSPIIGLSGIGKLDLLWALTFSHLLAPLRKSKELPKVIVKGWL